MRMETQKKVMVKCAWCKKVKVVDRWGWETEALAPEDYTHGICPSCLDEFFPGVMKKVLPGFFRYW